MLTAFLSFSHMIFSLSQRIYSSAAERKPSSLLPESEEEHTQVRFNLGPEQQARYRVLQQMFKSMCPPDY